MKKLKLVLIILAAVTLFPIASQAHEGEETETTSESIKAEDPAAVDARTERIEQAKKSFPIRLSENEQTRLANRCVKAQEKLSSIADRLDTQSPKITKKYDLIELHLTAIQKRLTNQQIDTSIIDLLITGFQELTTDYDTALLNYHQALDDAIAVGCTSEPQTFKALLENVRTERQVFVNSVEAIKSFVKADLKTGFDDLRSRLDNKGTEQ